jgi:RNA polymerase sigma-70 factor (ECF subfamily)
MDTPTLHQGSLVAQTRGQEAWSAAQRTENAYRRHHTALRRYALGLTRDVAVADDMVHDAFARLTVELQGGRAPDNVSAWLHRVVANLVASRGRRIQVAIRHADRSTAIELAASAETIVLDAELTRAVAEALRTLSPVDRRVVLLAAHGYPGPEIATLIGRTEAATRTLLCRARSRLRARLTEWETR